MSMYLRGSVYWVEFRDPDGNRVRETTVTGGRSRARGTMLSRDGFASGRTSGRWTAMNR